MICHVKMRNDMYLQFEYILTPHLSYNFRNRNISCIQLNLYGLLDNDRGMKASIGQSLLSYLEIDYQLSLSKKKKNDYVNT